MQLCGEAQEKMVTLSNTDNFNLLTTAMIKQFLTDVVWGDLDYLIIDTPPGIVGKHTHTHH